MSKEETIKNLKKLKSFHNGSYGTEIDEAIKALENDIPQMVNYASDGDADGFPVYDFAYCPNCDHLFEDGDENWEAHYCPYCGQALKWYENNACEDCYYNDGEAHAECVVCDIPVEKVAEAFINDVESVKNQLDGQPCEDAISRAELLRRIDAERTHLLDIGMDGAEHVIVHHARRIIEDMPSVHPQPMSGEWIAMSEGFSPYQCSECETVEFKKSSYCPNCGCRMNGGGEE